MAIPAITGVPGLTGLQHAPDETVRPGKEEKTDRTPSRSPLQPAKPQAKPDLHELEAAASKSGLEVRFDTLPGSNVTLIRMVDPATGQVVREFPPERLAKALAEIRAEATARLNRRSIDRRA
jgi:uncharacterized FlaG/YvyC family protein